MLAPLAVLKVAHHGSATSNGAAFLDAVAPSLSAGNAGGSVRFFSLFGPGGSHDGRLTPAELKLVSEWVDLGAQYFNDPFIAPLD